MLQKFKNWPPDYAAEYDFRSARLAELESSRALLDEAKAYYRLHPVEFIEDWCETWDPRNAGIEGKMIRMPFILFPRQREFIEFLRSCVEGEANGLVEKSRDMGATWLCVAFSVWLFLFVPGASVGWGSRKAMQVDRIGDMSSIFEKMRSLLRSIPAVLKPPGFGDDNMNHMKIWAPGWEASITGESGDDIGRGGRVLVYFKDESAHYEHPESIEAALSDTTRVQIDISSVNGLGNVFHRKREGGKEWSPGEDVVRDRTNVFVMDWSDHPEKTRAWYDEREAQATENGLLHIFRQEVDRNYAASVEGVVCPAAWVKVAMDAHLPDPTRKFYQDGIPDMEFNLNVGALDVADGGGDTNAFVRRRGVVLKWVEEWGERDTGVTTRRAIKAATPVGVKTTPIDIQYDCIGVGAGVKSEANRLYDDDEIPQGVSLIAWNAGAGVQDPEEHVVPDDPESALNEDFYKGLKPQGWWELRRRLEKTYRMITEGIEYPAEELISFDTRTIPVAMMRKLQKELSQPTASLGTKMKLVIDKAPNGTKSPNVGDATMMCYFPVKDKSTYIGDLSWVTGKKRAA